jgi:hypothetical protein
MGDIRTNEEDEIAVPSVDLEKGGTDSSDPPYSVFTPTQKRLLLHACSTAATFSTISSFIYFPAITAISKSLNVSTEQVN